VEGRGAFGRISLRGVIGWGSKGQSIYLIPPAPSISSNILEQE
jgi:hypothetical protein